MKVWIDITNAPHVLLFKDFVKELEQEHEVLVTARKFGYIEGLLDLYGVEAKLIGKHGGRDLYDKLTACIERESLLAPLINKEKPDFLVCKSSVEGPRVAYGLRDRIKSLYINDNEHSFGMNNLAMPLADRVLVPEFVNMDLIKSYGAKNIETFRGFCELEHLRNFRPDKKVLSELGVNSSSKLVTMRTSPVEAHYFNNNNGSVLSKLVDDLDCNVVALARNCRDREKLEKAGAIIPEHGVDSLSLMYYSDVFIGEGGSMNRESALLGTPTVSCYSDKLLAVDKELIKSGLMEHSLDEKEVFGFIEKADKSKSRERAEKFRENLEGPLDKVMEFLNET